MRIAKRIEVAPTSAEALAVLRGQTVRIVDVAGGQPGDLVAFNQHDLSERFSQARTRVEERACKVTTGNQLWTNTQPPRAMLTIVEDAAGGHDLLYTPCCRYALEKRFGVSGDGCLEHLAGALAPWGLTAGDVPDPLNLFFDVRVGPGGAISIGEHRSSTGDSIVLRAEMDCLLAVSTCSVPKQAGPSTGFVIEVGP